MAVAAVAAALALSWCTENPAEGQTAAATAKPASEGPHTRADRSSSPSSTKASEATPARATKPSPQSAEPESSLAPPSGCAAKPGQDCAFVDPSPDDLDELARCGMVRYEAPAALGDPAQGSIFDEAWVDQAELTGHELEVLREVAGELRDALRAEAVALALQAGMERDWADESATYIILGMVQAEDDELNQQALTTIAQERAGALPAPTSLEGRPPVERAARLVTGVGNRFEAAVAKRLGEARAAELRRLGDGWPGERGTIGNRCQPVVAESARDKEPVTTIAQARECIEQWRKFDCRFAEPEPLVIEEMSRCGIVRFDFPTFLMTRESEPAFEPAWADGAGLTADEADVIAEVAVGFRDALYADVAALAIEVGQTRAWADASPLLGLMGTLHEDVDDEALIEGIFAQVAKERLETGTVSPAGPEATVHERFIRRIVALGPAFEAAVAERLGSARASELRAHADGWPSVRMQTPSLCDD